MKILIEKNVKTYAFGRRTEYYRVKYKIRWFSPWRYWQCGGSDPEVVDFESLTEAKRVAERIREELIGPVHQITDLDINGEPINKYSGL